MLPGPPGQPAGVRYDSASVTSTSVKVIWLTGEQHGQPIQYHMIEACTEYNNTWTTITDCKRFEIIIIVSSKANCTRVHFHQAFSRTFFYSPVSEAFKSHTVSDWLYLMV